MNANAIPIGTEIQTYTCDIKEDKIKEILEKETTNLIELEQEEIKNKDDSSDKKKVDKFLTDSLKEYKANSAYADGKVVYGIKDKELVYVRLETGGLGTSYSLERIVLDQDVQVRDEPTFKGNTSSYYDLVLSYVEYKDSQSKESTDSESTTEEGTTSESTEAPETTEKADSKAKTTETPAPSATTKEAK